MRLMNLFAILSMAASQLAEGNCNTQSNCHTEPNCEQLAKDYMETDLNRPVGARCGIGTNTLGLDKAFGVWAASWCYFGCSSRSQLDCRDGGNAALVGQKCNGSELTELTLKGQHCQVTMQPGGNKSTGTMIHAVCNLWGVDPKSCSNATYAPA